MQLVMSLQLVVLRVTLVMAVTVVLLRQLLTRELQQLVALVVPVARAPLHTLVDWLVTTQIQF